MTKELKIKEISIGWDVGGWSGKNHGFCILESNESEFKVLMARKLNIYQIKDTIEDIIKQYSRTHIITWGIDAPLQFPKLFREVIEHHPINVFNTVQTNKKANPIAWRATDLHIKHKFGKTPLSASFSFLTSNATVAISLLGEIKAKYQNLAILPFDSEANFNAIEVYPGLLKSQLMQESKAFSDYFKILKDDSFDEIEGFDYYFKGAKLKTDVADAVICALYGLGFNGNLAAIPRIQKTIPTQHQDIVKEEGWIYYPKLS